MMMKEQERTDADVVVSRHYLERGKTSFAGAGRCPPGVYDRAALERDVFPNMMSFNRSRERGIHPNLWMKLFRAETVRDAILRVDPRILKANDFAACYEALYAANRISITTGRYYHYRMGRPKSITTSYVAKFYESMIALLDHLLSSPMARNPLIARTIPSVVRGIMSYGMQGGSGRPSAGSEEARLKEVLLSRLTPVERGKFGGAQTTAPRQRGALTRAGAGVRRINPVFSKQSGDEASANRQTARSRLTISSPPSARDRGPVPTVGRRPALVNIQAAGMAEGGGSNIAAGDGDVEAAPCAHVTELL
jgi:hypothetical protein